MPPRKRTAPPPDLGDKQPANATSDLEALRSEVAAEPDGERDGILAIPLGDSIVRVKDFMDWPSSANEDLGYGRYTMWARKVLAGNDFAEVWAPADPTNRQVAELLVNWEKISGLPLGTLLTSLTS